MRSLYSTGGDASCEFLILSWNNNKLLALYMPGVGWWDDTYFCSGFIRPKQPLLQGADRLRRHPELE